MKVRYVECRHEEIPSGVRWSVPSRNQGQIVEVAYGSFGSSEGDHGDPFKRVTDASVPAVTFYRRAGR
jgi:hypothetical protein